MIIGESARRLRPLGGGAAKAAEAAPRPPGQPVYAISEKPAAGDTRAAARNGRRPRAARPLVRGGALRGARHRPAPPRPRRLPLAHAGPDRGGTLVAVGGGRRHPLQGRGVRLDARRGAAAAGLDRPAGAAAGLRGAGAPRPGPAAARRGRRPCASSSAPRTGPRSGSTSRSACSTCSTTAPCSCERPPPRAARPRELERGQRRQRRPARRRALTARRARGRGARRAARVGADRPRRLLAPAARAGDARGGARRARRSRSRSSRCSTRSGSARSRAGRSRTTAPGPGRAKRRPRARWRRDAGRGRGADRRRARGAARAAGGDDPRGQPRSPDPLRARRCRRLVPVAARRARAARGAVPDRADGCRARRRDAARLGGAPTFADAPFGG